MCVTSVSLSRCGLLLLAMAAAMQGRAQVANTLTTAREVAMHVSREGDPPIPVALDATVTFEDPGHTIFLADKTGVTFIRGARDNPKVQRGDRLRIDGETHNGLYIGGIRPIQIQRLFSGPPMEPQAVSPEDLASGRFHNHWVSLTGVGRSVRSDDENSATLRMQSEGRSVEVRFDEALSDPASLVDAEIRVKGLAAGDINDRRQLVMPYLRVSSMADVEVLRQAPTDPFAVTEVPLADLQKPEHRLHRVKIRGIALSARVAGGLFLKAEDRSVFVRTDDTQVNPGDEVEALGFVEMGVFSAQLGDAQCRVIGSQAAPGPLPVGAKDLMEGMDAELVTLQARVLQRIDREDHTELLMQMGSQALNITAVLQSRAPTGLQANAEVRVTGLCRVTSTKSGGYRAKPVAYFIWARTEDDLILLQPAPWWTTQRLAFGLGSVALLALTGFGWAALLRRQVARQLTVIEAKAQREAITEERQRIAREFHDTLEQELAGLSLRLDAATPRVTDEKARSLLEQQRRLLLRLQTETRDFVWDLRDTSRTDAPVEEALRSLLDHLQVNTTTSLHFKAHGQAPKLPALMQHHLLRVTREAVNNAIKYAGASAITVELSIESHLLSLVISDDGRGFNVTAADSLDGHFGIRGMRERAKKLGADLRITSSSSEGTSVELVLPMAQQLS